MGGGAGGCLEHFCSNWSKNPIATLERPQNVAVAPATSRNKQKSRPCRGGMDLAVSRLYGLNSQRELPCRHHAVELAPGFQALQRFV